MRNSSDASASASKNSGAMATNLTAHVMDQFNGDTLKGVASVLGERPARTRAALSGVLPALIAGLSKKASSPDEARTLLDVIKAHHLDAGPYADVAGVLNAPGAINSLRIMGGPLVESLFGARAGGIADWISSVSRISRASSSSLLGLVLPLVLAQIGTVVKGTGWSASNLMNLLGEQRQFLQNAPAGLTGVLGLGEQVTRHVARSEEARGHAAAAFQAEPEERRSTAWMWTVAAVALIPLFLWMLRGRDEPRQASAATFGAGAVGTTGVASLGPLVERQLPDNVSLRIPANGVENKLIAYIEDGAQNPLEEIWFSFDRLEFQTDSVTLTPGASDQLRNIAAILKAYPEVKVKIGGYTDNTADSASNVTLSQDRANAAMTQIASLGIDRSRLTAEGYGERRPIADNAIEEERQRNRRVAIRVTDK
jgi:OOP family OmpA-OmpF porin